MVITKLDGGLGNQLFQYALGRNLAKINNVDLKLDISNYHEGSSRQYGLKYFKIKENIASPDEIRAFTKYKPSLFYKLSNYFKPYKYKKYISQYKNPFSHVLYAQYNRKILKSSSEVYLDGFWQSEKYFNNISDILKKEYILLPEYRVMNGTVEAIKNCNSVALHIRRGDYIRVPETSAIHGVLPISYYKKAFILLKDLIKDPEFFVFTDDVGWTKRNFDIGINYKIVSEDNSPDYAEFGIMSGCKHFIIANSSFSWWGAWLGSFPEKIVVAPKKWFNDPRYDTGDILPPAWLKV